MASSLTKRPGLTRPPTLNPDVKAAIDPLNDLVNRVTGVTLTKVKKLPSTATLAQVIAKVNELIDRIQED